MAKKSKMKSKVAKKLAKKNKKQAIKWGAGTGIVAGLAGDVLVRVVSRLLEEQLEPHLKRGSKKKGEPATEETDVAAHALKLLADRGPLSIPDLLTLTGTRLVALLRALQEVRAFCLIEFSGDDSRVQLTSAGERTATVLGKQTIRRDAELLLAS